MEITGDRLTLLQAADLVVRDSSVSLSTDVLDKLVKVRKSIDAAAAGDAPVYGLNTGLGANLGHRIAPEDIPAFQKQLVAGRAVATGNPLPEQTGRAMLLSRIRSLANGHSGMSPALAIYLCDVFNSGLSPVVPEYGSVGASDLTQNAVWAMSLLGEGDMWSAGQIGPAGSALRDAGLASPELQPKDAMALINHSGLTVARAIATLSRATEAIGAAKLAALLSIEGFAANRDIFAPDIQALRPAPGQADAARWFADRLADSKTRPNRIQDALSFRTLAPVTGAAEHALAHSVSVLEDELNGSPDSPAVMPDGALISTPNFHTPALALALDALCPALAMMANGASQRIQKLMNPDLSGLPKYLSPIGGSSAGMVPLQKTAAALLSDIRRHASSYITDAQPVSDTVEDMAPNTPLAARKLDDLLHPFTLLISAEAVVAAQALDLQKTADPGQISREVHRQLREKIPGLEEDRACGPDVSNARDTLLRLGHLHS